MAKMTLAIWLLLVVPFKEGSVSSEASSMDLRSGTLQSTNNPVTDAVTTTPNRVTGAVTTVPKPDTGTLPKTGTLPTKRPLSTKGKNDKRSNEEKTKEKQEKNEERAASRLPKIKDSLDKIKQAKTRSEVQSAIKIITEEVKKTYMAVYELNAVSSTVFKFSKKSKKISTLELIKNLGSLALILPEKEYTRMDKASLFHVLKIGRESSDGRSLTYGAQKMIFKTLVKVVPKKEWTKVMGGSLSPLKDVLEDNKDLKKLPQEAIVGIFFFLGNVKADCGKKPPRIVKVYISSSKITKDILSVGKLLCHLSMKQLKSIPKSAISTKADVQKLCRVNWNRAKAKVVAALARNQSNFKNLKNLTCEEIRMFRNCWNGVERNTFEGLNITLDKINCFNSTILPEKLKSALAKNIKNLYGPLNKLGVGEIKKIISSYGATAYDLRSLNKTVLKNVSNEIEDQIKRGGIKNKVTVKIAAELIVKEKIKDKLFKLARIPLKAVSKLTTSTLMTVPVDKLGFSESDLDDEESTSTDRDYEDERPLSLDIVVIEKLEKKYGKVHNNSMYWKKAIKRIPFLCALDISKTTDADFYDFVSLLEKYGFRCPSLMKMIIKRYEKIKTNEESSVLTDYDFKTLGAFAAGFDYRFLVNTTADEETRRMAIDRFKKNCETKVFSTKRMKNISKVALAMLNIRSGSAVTVDSIDTLMCLLKFVDLNLWKDVSKDTIAEASETLGKYDFATDVRKTFLAKIKEKHGSLNELTSEQFGKYINVIGKALTAADVGSIKQDVLKDNADKLATVELKVDVATAVHEKIGGVRKRRAVTDLSSKSSLQITEMGTLLYGLTTDAIKTINNNVFKEVLDVIGKLAGFSKDQREAWVAVLKSAFAGIGNVADDDLKRIGYIILGMTSGDIQQLSLKNLEVISDLSSISGYTSSQISDIFAEIKKDLGRAALKDFTGDELSASAKFVPGANHNEIKEILGDTYKEAARELGDVVGWTSDQMHALKSVAVKAYGQVITWTPVVINDVGAAIGGATAEEIKSVIPSTFKAIKPVAIKQIPVNTFKELTTDQFFAMTSAQLAAVTIDQKNALSEDQTVAFREASGANQILNLDSLISKKHKCDDCDSGAARHTSVLLVISVAISFVSLLWS